MSKKRAIEICKLLDMTIEKMTPDQHIEHKNEVFEIPRADKNQLKRIKKRLIIKYKLTVEHLKN